MSQIKIFSICIDVESIKRKSLVAYIYLYVSLLLQLHKKITVTRHPISFSLRMKPIWGRFLFIIYAFGRWIWLPPQASHEPNKRINQQKLPIIIPNILFVIVEIYAESKKSGGTPKHVHALMTVKINITRTKTLESTKPVES